MHHLLFEIKCKVYTVIKLLEVIVYEVKSRHIRNMILLSELSIDTRRNRRRRHVSKHNIDFL